ncbi:PD-(D/E)XK nuclease family protein [Synechocystis sp. LKSZ1]|uniref:PD-(D/E)XK nuclease family protein n=1 Tax=Synechocystis sp. LKSZ1 TaxID=3144951 RepID=UPI00336BB406
MTPNYPRVTHILSATEDEKSRNRLRKWQNKMDRIHGANHAEQISEEARNNGTRFHLAIEKFFTEGKRPNYSDPNDYLEQRRWDNAEPHLRIIANEYLALEKEVISHKHQYLGHLDCLAWNNGRPIICDWKTSKRVKQKSWLTDYFLQATAYALAVDEEGQLDPIEECRIYIFSPDKAQLFTLNPNDYREQWLSRLEKYHATQLVAV